MSFSPFYLMFVPQLCHSMRIHFLLFGAISLFFSRSHIIITVTRCLFIFFPSLPFFLFTISLFYARSFYCRFFLSSTHCLCVRRRRRRKNEETGTLKCVDKAYFRTFDFISSKTFQSTPSLDGRNMSARNDNSDGIVTLSLSLYACVCVCVWRYIGAASATTWIIASIKLHTKPIMSNASYDRTMDYLILFLAMFNGCMSLLVRFDKHFRKYSRIHMRCEQQERKERKNIVLNFKVVWEQ